MFRNMLAASLRNLHRSKFHTGIAVFGLAIGVASAVLAALYVRNLYSHEHFVPGYKGVYLAAMEMTNIGRPSIYTPESPGEIAPVLKLRVPGLRAVTRLARERVRVRVGGNDVPMFLYSADPSLFTTLPLAVAAGDPIAALAQPDRLVLTRELARVIFGDDAVLGRTVSLALQDGSTHAVVVGAVLEDIPRKRTQLQAGMFVSGISAWTHIAEINGRTGKRNGIFTEVLTLIRLDPGDSPNKVKLAWPEIMGEIAGPGEMNYPGLDMVRIDRVNTHPGLNPGINSRILMASMLGLIVLVIAVVNFVNLLTARSAGRATEVGVRKLAGAGRNLLAAQFTGEAVAHVAIAVLLAVAMTELALPHVNAFLGADAQFDYWKDPKLLGWGVLAVAALGGLAGFWPAVVLSSLRPLGAIHGPGLSRGSGRVLRQGLVTLQFALLIGLIVATGVVSLQRQYATQRALRFDTDQMLIVEADCTPARLVEIRKVAGVRDAACSSDSLTGDSWGTTDGKTRDGKDISISIVWVDDHALELFGIRPIAGRALSASDVAEASEGSARRYLINETAVRRLGFESAEAAIGLHKATKELDEIVGVLPDFSMASVGRRIEPTVYFGNGRNWSNIDVKLKGDSIPATLAAIDKIWSATGGIGKLERYFYAERVERMYQAMLREAQSFGLVSVVAVLLACLGMLGLAAAVAKQRTKEIGIRKALGANSSAVLGLLLWQFSKPVVWANLIAWPVSAWLMQRWLDGFAYHIDLPLWLFPAAGFSALLIALATVFIQSLRVAAAKPVAALRYE
jgi:putative ABC transport system permease protein